MRAPAVSKREDSDLVIDLAQYAVIDPRVDDSDRMSDSNYGARIHCIPNQNPRSLQRLLRVVFDLLIAVVVGSTSFAVDVRIPILTRFAFATDLNEHLLPETPGHDFPLGTERVFASLQVFNAPHDLILTAKWTVNGEVVEEQEIMWEAEFDRGPGSFQIISVDSPDAGSPLPAGDHRLMIIRDGREVLNDVFKVG